jgi:putative flippase GtrA
MDYVPMVMRYMLVGGSAYVAHLAVFVALRQWAGLIAANSLGFILAIFINYFGQCMFVFKGSGYNVAGFKKYTLACLLGLFAHTVMVYFFLLAISSAYVAHVSASAVLFAANYFIGKHIIFKT